MTILFLLLHSLPIPKESPYLEGKSPYQLPRINVVQAQLRGGGWEGWKGLRRLRQTTYYVHASLKLPVPLATNLPFWKCLWFREVN